MQKNASDWKKNYEAIIEENKSLKKQNRLLKKLQAIDPKNSFQVEKFDNTQKLSQEIGKSISNLTDMKHEDLEISGQFKQLNDKLDQEMLKNQTLENENLVLKKQLSQQNGNGNGNANSHKDLQLKELQENDSKELLDKIKNLQQELQEFQETKILLKKRNAEYENLKSKQNEYENLIQGLQQRVEELDRFKDDLALMTDEYHRVKEENDQIFRDLEELKKRPTKEETQIKLNAKDEEIEELKKRPTKEDIENLLIKKKEEIESKDKEIEKGTQELSRLTTENEKLTSELAEFQEVLAEFEKKKIETETRLDKYKQSAILLKEQYEIKELESIEKDQEIKKLQENEENLLEQIKNLKGDNTNQDQKEIEEKEEISKLNEKINKLQEENAQAISEKETEIIEANGRLEQERLAHEQTKVQFDSQLLELRKERDENKKSLKDIELKLTQVQKDNDEYRQLTEKMDHSIKEKDALIAQINEQKEIQEQNHSKEKEDVNPQPQPEPQQGNIALRVHSLDQKVNSHIQILENLNLNERYFFFI